MADLVIFDCDGVLVDSERLAVKIDVKILSQLGWEVTEDEVIDRFVGLSDSHFKRAVEAQIGRRLPDNWEDEFRPLYRTALAQELTAVDGVIEALDQITIQSCVASSGTHEKMRYTLGLTKLYDRFDGRIFSATEVSHGKPAPDLFLYAAERMGVSPADCVVVEDSAMGVTAARAAGMRVLAYGAGVTPAHKLLGPQTTVFMDMCELPALLQPNISLQRP
jgi:HAD superfamily hydrolase (TIGR01509 family)